MCTDMAAEGDSISGIEADEDVDEEIRGSLLR